MVGKGSPGVLGVHSPDQVLSVVGPLGLAASVGTCLVVDLLGDISLPTNRTLADLASDGPRLEELSPGRSGVAVLSAGPVSSQTAHELIGRLAERWPAVVVRTSPGLWPGKVVPVYPLLPGWAAPDRSGAAVWQQTPGGSTPPGPGPVLPRLGSRVVRQLLSGRLPTRSRWVRAWEHVWELPWA